MLSSNIQLTFFLIEKIELSNIQLIFLIEKIELLHTVSKTIIVSRSHACEITSLICKIFMSMFINLFILIKINRKIELIYMWKKKHVNMLRL